MPQAVVAWSHPEMFRAYATGQLAMNPVGTYFTANAVRSPLIVQLSGAMNGIRAGKNATFFSL